MDKKHFLHAAAFFAIIHPQYFTVTLMSTKSIIHQLRHVSETGEPLYVRRNKQVAAVIMLPGEYEALKEMEEIFEHFEMFETVQERLKSYDPSQNVTLEEICKLESKRGVTIKLNAEERN